MESSSALSLNVLDIRYFDPFRNHGDLKATDVENRGKFRNFLRFVKIS